MKANDVTTHYLDQQFNKPSGHFAELPENDECFFIPIHQDFFDFIYNPIAQDTPHPEAPKWTMAFVDFINFAVQFKKWHHNLVRPTLARWNVCDPLEFLLDTDTFLQEIGIITKTDDNDGMSDDGSEEVIEASSCLSNGKQNSSNVYFLT